MRIGIGINLSGTIDKVLERVTKAEADGFAAAWIAGGSAFDALTLAALAGRMTSSIEIGTFVVPTYPRHPSVMATQTITTAAATGNRFTLGIGLSHQVVIEGRLGLDFSKPIRHMREYLQILGPALDGETVSLQGQEYRVNGIQAKLPGATRPPLLIAALGPQMLRLAGTYADGTATWMGNVRYLEQQAVPTIRAAAEAAGRPVPRVLAGFPIAVTSDAAAARAAAARSFANYGALPSYQATIVASGAAAPEEIAIIGDEATVARELRQLRDAGVTDFHASPFGVEGDPDCRTRTNDFLAGLQRSGL